MKKTLLIIAMAFVGSFAFAQKPSSGEMTTEVLARIQTGSAALGFSVPEMRFRYFLSDDMAVRARLNIGMTSKTETDLQGSSSAEIKTSGSNILIAPGIEKFFAGTSNLAPYVGAELAIGLGSNKVEATNSSNGTSYTNVNDKYATEGGGTTTIGLNILMGADYYITDAIYVGGEFGWGFMSKSTAQKDISSTAGATTNKMSQGKISNTDIGISSTGGVRLGIKF